MEKLCIFCKHFHMLKEDEHPNELAEVCCIKGEWFLYLSEGEDELRIQIRRAKICKHYSPVDH